MSTINMSDIQDIIDPMKMKAELWPDITFYREQKEIIYSVADNDETFVPAGNMLGKDFVAGFIALWFFMSRHPCRVVTTSVDGTQLEGVLWGEIRRFIQTAKTPLECERGGPLLVNHLQLRKMKSGQPDGLSYCIGRVAAKGEGMLGHHVAKTHPAEAYTLFIADEASGVDDVSYERSDTWAHRKLIIGNPYPCTNFFFKGVKAGDLRADTNNHMYRKVIKIRGQDSPNVRMGEAQKKSGRKIQEEMIIPGVLSYGDYIKRRAVWEPMRQCIGLDAEFYEGAEVRLFPPAWLNRAANIAEQDLRPKGYHGLRTMGVDPAEGGDSSVWTILDKYGIIDQIGMKTPDTTVVTSRTLALMQEYGISPECVFFDRGGGGKEHADRLRLQGHRVNSVGFGESASGDDRFVRRMKTKDERTEEAETMYAYKNRRAQMYGEVRLMLDPSNEQPFGIHVKYEELRRQMDPLPLIYDPEGRLMLPPKNKRSRTSTEVTITDILGCSPDETDSFVLAAFGLSHKPRIVVVGVGF